MALFALPFLGGLGTGAAAFIGRVLIVHVVVDLVLKILVPLGLGIATYTFGSYAIDELFGFIKTNLSQAPADALSLAEIAGMNEFFSIVFGALSIRITLAGLNKAKFIFQPNLGGS